MGRVHYELYNVSGCLRGFTHGYALNTGSGKALCAARAIARKARVEVVSMQHLGQYIHWHLKVGRKGDVLGECDLELV